MLTRIRSRNQALRRIWRARCRRKMISRVLVDRRRFLVPKGRTTADTIATRRPQRHRWLHQLPDGEPWAIRPRPEDQLLAVVIVPRSRRERRRVERLATFVDLAPDGALIAWFRLDQEADAPLLPRAALRRTVLAPFIPAMLIVVAYGIAVPVAGRPQNAHRALAALEGVRP